MIGILGVGNILRGDDGVGIKIVEELKEKSLPSNIKVLELGTGGLKIIHKLEEFERVLIIDSVKMNSEPGDFRFFSPSEVKFLKKSDGTHGTSIMEIIKISENLGFSPDEITILGIQPKNQKLGTDLSDEVEEKIPKIIDSIFEKLEIKVK